MGAVATKDFLDQYMIQPFTLNAEEAEIWAKTALDESAYMVDRDTPMTTDDVW
jgi:hypothetical protein